MFRKLRWGPLLVLGAVACGDNIETGENPDDWFDSGSFYQVQEAIEFTDVPYDIPANPADGIAQLLADTITGTANQTVFSTAAYPSWGGACNGWGSTGNLPREIEAVVTILPRSYFKSNGCAPNNNFNDEKYYGSFFLEDNTGGVFIVGDTKVDLFGPGDKIRIRVHGMRRSFDLNLIYNWELLDIERDYSPVYYQPATSLGAADVGETRRVVGEVVTEPDTFGSFQIRPDGVDPLQCDPETGRFFQCVVLSLDSEINRRRYHFPVGSRIQATGPVTYSFSTYQINILEKGQIQALD